MLKTAILATLSTLTLLALGVAIGATSTGESPITKTHRDKALDWTACPGTFLPEGCRMALLRGNPAKSGADVFVKRLRPREAAARGGLHQQRAVRGLYLVRIQTGCNALHEGGAIT